MIRQIKNIMNFYFVQILVNFQI